MKIKVVARGSRKVAALGLLVVALAFLLITVVPSSAQEAPPSIASVETSALSFADEGRNFYLTSTSYYGNQPLTACGAGYHMASLWEIIDVSNLTYASNHPAAHKKADSGSGPPSYWYGWIRTGQDSSAINVAGTANCSTWTSNVGTDYGSMVRLSRAWETAPGDIQNWDAATWACSGTAPVWCVGDFSQVYLPLAIKGQ